MFNRISAYWWLVVSVTCLLWLPFLLSKGMFLDGVYNAALARNIAIGIGTFWTPSANYLDTPVSWGCAPFSVFTLSLSYKILGTHYAVERFYSLICALAQLALIAAVWKSVFPKNDAFNRYTWLPCLLWLGSPLTGWCFSNNLMENTMVILTTASILTLLLYSRKQTIAYPIVGSALIFLAVLSKGPVGLFPLAAPLLFLLAAEKENRGNLLRYFCIQATGFILLFVLVFSMEAPCLFLENYMNVQLKPALNHTGGKTSYEILAQLGIALLPMIILFIATVFFSNFSLSFSVKKDVFQEIKSTRTAAVFILIGLSASLPILLSVKQSKFYLLPSLGMFAIGFSLLILPVLMQIIHAVSALWQQRISAATKIISATLIFISLALCFYNQGIYSRDKALLNDVDNIQNLAGNRALLRADWEMNTEWHLFAYLNRLYEIRICMPDIKNETPYYLTYSGRPVTGLTTGYERIYSGEKFDLYSKSNLRR